MNFVPEFFELHRLDVRLSVVWHFGNYPIASSRQRLGRLEFTGEPGAAGYVSRVMRHFATFAILLVAGTLFLSGCATTSVDTTSASDPVPGEKVSEEGRVAPGAGTAPNASVKW